MAEGEDRMFELELEKGYCRVPNLLLDALSLVRLNGTQLSVYLYVMRRTIGWNHEYDAIPLSDIAAACRISRKNASRQISCLVDKKMIRRLECRNQVTNLYGLVTDPTEWDEDCIDMTALLDNRRMAVYKGIPPERLAASREDDRKQTDPGPDPVIGSGGDLAGGEVGPWEGDTYPEQIQAWPEFELCLNTDKDKKNNKDSKNSKDSQQFDQDSIPFQLSELLLVKIKEHLPKFKQPDLHKWSQSMERLIRLDKRNPEEVREVILFAQADPFWCANILSVDSLREKYDRLNMKRIHQKASPYESEQPIKRKEVNAADSGKYDYLLKK